MSKIVCKRQANWQLDGDPLAIDIS